MPAGSKGVPVPVYMANPGAPFSGGGKRYTPYTDVRSVEGGVKFRDVVRALEADGWHLERQSGSHRQYRHSGKPGTVTVATHNLGKDVKPGTLISIWKQAGLKGPK